MKLQVGVKVLLKNEEGKYLLLHRNTEKYKGVQGEWDIVGGRIDPGTPLIENLQREVYEETGLTLSTELTLIAAQDILLEEKHIVRLTYIGSAEGDMVLDTSENDQYRWYTKEEMEQEENLDRYLREVVVNNLN